MHIGLIVDRLIGRNGGELSIAEFAGELVRQGVQVTVLAAGQARSSLGPPGQGGAVGGQAAPDRQAGFEAVSFGLGKLQSPAAWAACQRAVQREAAARNIDLLHSMGPLVACDLFQPRGGTVAETYQRYLAMPRSMPGRWRARWKLWSSPAARATLRRERRFCTRQPGPLMIAISGYVARQFREHYAVPSERVRQVAQAVRAPRPDGAQRSAWRRRVRGELNVSDSALLVLMAAHHFHQKGLGYLLEAMAAAESRVRPPSRASEGGGMALIVLGRDEAAPYRRQARRLGLQSPVHYVGEIDPEARWPFFAAADLLALPTVYDSMGRTILESLAMGTPVLTTAHCGLADQVRAWGVGQVISTAWAIGELADAIAAAGDPARRQAWNRAAEELAGGAALSIERMTGEMLEIYRQVLAEKGRA